MSYFEIGIRILTLLGALGVFLYGMKLMSESLQKLAGQQLRGILSAMTANRYYGILAGFTVTGIVQSSSAITVMIVSFVNAGLLSVKGSIAMIMGANIGTTVTAWLVSIFGFAFSIKAIALPLIGISLPFLFSSRSRWRSWGEFVLGFSLLFTGLGFMKDIFPLVEDPQTRYAFLSAFGSTGFLTNLYFVGMGVIITAIVQSSSATITLTTVLAFSGIISLEHAAAMVLGENIGTTLTANLAATVANTQAKRAARAHFLINLIGVTWMLPILPWFLVGLDRLFSGVAGHMVLIDQAGLAVEGRDLLPMALAAFHSLFNLINVLLLSFFIPHLSRLTRKLVREGQGTATPLSPAVNTGLVSFPELSMLEARQGIHRMGQLSFRMVRQTAALFREKDELRSIQLIHKLQEKYDRMESLERRMKHLLTALSAEELSPEASRWISVYGWIAARHRAIARLCVEVEVILEGKRASRIWFTQDLRDNLNAVFEALTEVSHAITKHTAFSEKGQAHQAQERVLLSETLAHKFLQELQGLKATADHLPSGSLEIYRDILLALQRISGQLDELVKAWAQQQVADVHPKHSKKT